MFRKYLCLGDYFKIWSYFLCHSCRLWSVYADVKAFFLNKSLQKLDCFLMPEDIQHRLAHFIVVHIHLQLWFSFIYLPVWPLLGFLTWLLSHACQAGLYWMAGANGVEHFLSSSGTLALKMRIWIA